MSRALSFGRAAVPPLHPLVEALRARTSTLPYVNDFWSRADLHRTWSQVEVNFERERWERELRVYELLEVQTLEKLQLQRLDELRTIVVRTAADQAFHAERQREIDTIQHEIDDKKKQLEEYKESFRTMCELQERVLMDKKELQFAMSLVPVPYYLFAVMSTLVGLYYLFRQPVKQRLVDIMAEVRALRSDVKELQHGSRVSLPAQSADVATQAAEAFPTPPLMLLRRVVALEAERFYVTFLVPYWNMFWPYAQAAFRRLIASVRSYEQSRLLQWEYMWSRHRESIVRGACFCGGLTAMAIVRRR